MNPEDFQNFRKNLKDNLNQLETVTGLAFVGSAADTSRADEWSDHDFFVFTTDGNAEGLRQDLTWLPDYEDIVLFVRETEHGLKVIYNDGHVLEFAIFEDDWELSGVNLFEVTLDKSSIAERMAEAQARSVPKPIDLDREFSLFLAHLLIGTGRFRRGETLSARQFINTFCVNSVVRLVTELIPPSTDSRDTADNQNPFRRFEVRYPEMSNELEAIQRKDLESAALELLGFVKRNLAGHLKQQQIAQIAVIEDRLGWQ